MILAESLKEFTGYLGRPSGSESSQWSNGFNRAKDEPNSKGFDETGIFKARPSANRSRKGIGGHGKGKQKKGYWVHLTDSGRAYRVHDISTRPTLGMDISMVSPTERCSHHGIWPIMLTRTLPSFGSRLLPKEGAI